MMYKTETVRIVHYAEACAGFGAARLAGLINDRETLTALSIRYSRVIVRWRGLGGGSFLPCEEKLITTKAQRH